MIYNHSERSRVHLLKPDLSVCKLDNHFKSRKSLKHLFIQDAGAYVRYISLYYEPLYHIMYATLENAAIILYVCSAFKYVVTLCFFL